MAVIAAKYGHCNVAYPVTYRSRVPFRPEIAAPLDLSARLSEIWAHDRELDRAVLGLDQYDELLEEGVDWGLGAGELFASDLDPSRPQGSSGPELDRAQDLAEHRQRFGLNELQFLSEGARFRPPWTVHMVQAVHEVLFQKLDVPFPPGELRERSFVGVGPAGTPVYRACPPESVAKELAAVLEWVDRVGPTLAPVIPATVLMHSFQSVRPFPSGNHAVGWMLSQYYLHLFGLPNAATVPFASTEASDPELRLRLMLWTEVSGSFTELVDHTVDAVRDAYRAGRTASEPETRR
ncbi:MAG: Fic family protein, partial [Thermoplasmata archaeon]|nr:Fic family protein [Thermoplasmata archaeon]